MDPYYSDEWTTLYLGDCREVLPALGVKADVAICDPPYQETSLKWDRWPEGWPAAVAHVTDQMWCFGSMRMFFDRLHEFADWKFAQDVVWEKNTGSVRAADRFRRVHEHAVHWYRGRWGDLYRDPQRERSAVDQGDTARSSPGGEHMNAFGARSWRDDGTRLVRSVIYAANMRGKAENSTQKPLGVVSPVVAYSCPPGGLVIEAFAGSGPAVRAARLSGRRSVGVEADEAQCEALALRLGQVVMFDDECVDPPPVSVPAVPSPSPLF